MGDRAAVAQVKSALAAAQAQLETERTRRRSLQEKLDEAQLAFKLLSEGRPSKHASGVTIGDISIRDEYRQYKDVMEQKYIAKKEQLHALQKLADNQARVEVVLRNEINSLKSAVEGKDKQIGRLSFDHSLMAIDLNAKEAELRKLRATAASGQSQSAEVTTLRNELAEERRRIEKYKRQEQVIIDRMKRAEGDLAPLQAKLLEANRLNVTDRHKAAEDATAASERHERELKQEKDRAAALEAENGQLKCRIRTLESAPLLSPHESVPAMRDQLEQERRSSARHIDRCEILEGRLRTSQETIMDLNDQIETYRSQLESAANIAGGNNRKRKREDEENCEPSPSTYTPRHPTTILIDTPPKTRENQPTKKRVLQPLSDNLGFENTSKDQPGAARFMAFTPITHLMKEGAEIIGYHPMGGEKIAVFVKCGSLHDVRRFEIKMRTLRRYVPNYVEGQRLDF